MTDSQFQRDDQNDPSADHERPAEEPIRPAGPTGEAPHQDAENSEPGPIGGDEHIALPSPEGTPGGLSADGAVDEQPTEPESELPQFSRDETSEQQPAEVPTPNPTDGANLDAEAPSPSNAGASTGPELADDSQAGDPQTAAAAIDGQVGHAADSTSDVGSNVHITQDGTDHELTGDASADLPDNNFAAKPADPETSVSDNLDASLPRGDLEAEDSTPGEAQPFYPEADPAGDVQTAVYHPGQDEPHFEQLPLLNSTDKPLISWGPYNPHEDDSNRAGSGPQQRPDTFGDSNNSAASAPIAVIVSLAESQVAQLIDAALGKSAARDVQTLSELAESVVEHAFWLRTCHERALNG